MLAIESRNTRDQRTLGNLFYECCDEMEDLKLAAALAFLIELLNEAMAKFIKNEQIESIFSYFAGSLPSGYKVLLGISACES